MNGGGAVPKGTSAKLLFNHVLTPHRNCSICALLEFSGANPLLPGGSSSGKCLKPLVNSKGKRMTMLPSAVGFHFGGVSRAAKGADCKSAGFAFVGSSPTSPTTSLLML